MNIDILRDIKIDIILGKYKCISSYTIPDDYIHWLPCGNCGLRPLIWVFDNGSSTACGCGYNEYRHFSISSESIMSYVSRNNGSAIGYDNNELKNNWNKWVMNGDIFDHSMLVLDNKW